LGGSPHLRCADSWRDLLKIPNKMNIAQLFQSLVLMNKKPAPPQLH
jgi:hypothetical protein